jgi:hypothetical protein
VSGYIPDFSYQGIDGMGAMSVSVTNVSVPSISFTADISYRNGTETSQEVLINVQTGGYRPENNSIPRFFLSANLGVDESVIPYRAGPKINDTIVTSYSNGESRETNYFRVDGSGSNDTYYSYIDSYYDKETGVLVKFYCYGENTNGPFSTSFWLELERTNLWVISESSCPSQPPSYFLGSTLPDYAYFIMVTVAVVAVEFAVLLVYFRKRKP